MSNVLGIAIGDDEVSSVVVAGDQIVAAEISAPADDSIDELLVFIHSLAESSAGPFGHIVITSRDERLLTALSAIFSATGRNVPRWYRSVVAVESPAAYAAAAGAALGSRGTVVVAELAADGAPYPRLSVTAADSGHRVPICAAETPGSAERIPVTEALGADSLATGIALMPLGSREPNLLMACGPGAELPGVPAALEEATRLPVQIAESPVFTLAFGAVLAAIADPAPARRIGARGIALLTAAAVALVVAVATSLLLTRGDSEPMAVADSSRFVQSSTTPPRVAYGVPQRSNQPGRSLPRRVFHRDGHTSDMVAGTNGPGANSRPIRGPALVNRPTPSTPGTTESPSVITPSTSSTSQPPTSTPPSSGEPETTPPPTSGQSGGQ